MKLKLSRPNAPHRAMGPRGTPKQKAPLNAGAHMPMRHSGSLMESPAVRRNGKHTGQIPPADTNMLPAKDKGNSKGTAPPTLGNVSRGTLDKHLGDSGRGGTGRIGKHDGFKGQPTKYTEDISHSAFEKLGAS
jgi:hypothetical protein